MLSTFKITTPFSIVSRAFSSSAFVAVAAKKSATKKETPKKTKKAAPKVKRPLSAYNAFTSNAFQTRRAELLDLPFGERSALLSKEWKNLSSIELKRYTEIAEKDRIRFEEEKEIEAKNAPPKRPLNSYALFFKEIRDELISSNPSATFTDLGKLAGEKWKSLSESEKSPYQEAFIQNKAEYVKALESYKPKA